MAYFIYHSNNVYYEEIGEGAPLFLLHGNTASSKMFDLVLSLYRNSFKVILIDFLGHGQSDRLKEFPTDFWYDEALQVIELISQRNYQRVNIIGTSGGALAAINVALEHPELVACLVADSFEGEHSVKSIVENIRCERDHSKTDQHAREFWKFNHGDDWESVIDNDTQVNILHHKQIRKFFHKDLSCLKRPILLTGSLEDNYVSHIDVLYADMLKRITQGSMYIFSKGWHPAMISNAVEFSEVSKEFINGQRLV